MWKRQHVSSRACLSSPIVSLIASMVVSGATGCRGSCRARARRVAPRRARRCACVWRRAAGEAGDDDVRSHSRLATARMNQRGPKNEIDLRSRSIFFSAGAAGSAARQTLAVGDGARRREKTSLLLCSRGGSSSNRHFFRLGHSGLPGLTWSWRYLIRLPSGTLASAAGPSVESTRGSFVSSQVQRVSGDYFLVLE